MSTKANILRKLSPSEAIFIRWNVSILAISQIQGIFTPALLNEAMRVLSNRHPLLTAKVIKKSDSYYLQTTDNHIQVEVEHCNNAQERLAFHRNYTDQKLDIHQQLIRIILIYYDYSAEKNDHWMDMITITSHAISDGISCTNLHKEILNTCEAISQKLDLNLKPLPIISPIEFFIKRELGVINKNKIMRKFKKMITCPHAQTPPYKSNARQADMTLSQFILDEKLVNSMRKSCRENKVTMIGALYVALLIFLYDQLDCKKSERFLCRTSINLRSLLKEPIAHEHLLTAATGHFLTIKLNHKQQYWKIAKKISKEIIKRKKDGFILKEHLCYADLLNMTSNLPIAFSVSNVGVTDIPIQFNGFKVISFSFAVGGYNSKHIELIFNTFNNKMFCTIQYDANRFSEGFIKSLESHLPKILAHYNL